jgi:hypothetical protein
MNDQPPRSPDPHREAKLEALRRALIEGEESGDAGPLDMAEIIRKAREEAGLGPADASASQIGQGRTRSDQYLAIWL